MREPDAAEVLEAEPAPRAHGATLDFDDVYAQYFDFVWRSVRHLGVPQHALDDAVQDVFVVVHLRLAEFEGRSTLRTWIFGIVRRIVRNHRPKPHWAPSDRAALEAIPDARRDRPDERAETVESARLLYRLLDQLAPEKREAFVLAEIEQIPVPEVADALGLNLNTAYSRVRTARLEIQQQLERLRAREPSRG